MKKILLLIIIIGGVAGSVGYFYWYKPNTTTTDTTRVVEKDVAKKASFEAAQNTPLPEYDKSVEKDFPTETEPGKVEALIDDYITIAGIQYLFMNNTPVVIEQNGSEKEAKRTDIKVGDTARGIFDNSNRAAGFVKLVVTR